MSAYALMHDPIRITITPPGTKAGVVNSHAGSAELKPTASRWSIFSPALQRLLLLFYGYLSPFSALRVLPCVTLKWVSWMSSKFLCHYQRKYARVCASACLSLLSRYFQLPLLLRRVNYAQTNTSGLQAVEESHFISSLPDFYTRKWRLKWIMQFCESLFIFLYMFIFSYF